MVEMELGSVIRLWMPRTLIHLGYSWPFPGRQNQSDANAALASGATAQGGHYVCILPNGARSWRELAYAAGEGLRWAIWVYGRTRTHGSGPNAFVQGVDGEIVWLCQQKGAFPTLGCS